MVALSQLFLLTCSCSTLWTVCTSSSTYPRSGCGNFSDLLLGEAVVAFDKMLYAELARTEAGNIFYSPFGLHVLLSEAFFGSPRESATAKELEKLLGFRGDDLQDYLCAFSDAVEGLGVVSEGFEVGTANRVFVADDLVAKSDYESTLATHFKSGLQRVDFHVGGAASVINGFVNDQTRGLIQDVVQEEDLTLLTRMVLVHAIYFKGRWQTAFSKSDTTKEIFHVDDGRNTSYDAMHLTARLQHSDLKDLEAEVLHIPYTNEKFGMVVVLPHKGSNISQVESNVGENNLVFDVLESSDAFRDVTLSLPKFDVNFDMAHADDVLGHLGVRSMFQPRDANFSEISDEPLFISKLVHKGVVKVDEDGTEAAAASTAIVDFRFAITPKIMFTVDRPFLFYIYDKVAKMPIFKGRIVDPNGQIKLKL